MTTMTRELLEQGRSCMGGYSRAQFDLIGVETRSPPGSPANMNRIPKKWWVQVIGKDYSDEVIAAFVELKDKHLNPTKIAYQIKVKLKKEADRAARAAEKIAPLPDGMYDVERRNRREIWEAGKIAKWHLKRSVQNWGAYPDAPPERSTT